MSGMKKLLLGGAVGLVAFTGTGAQAADLPLKAKAVEYVKVCTLYGAGFYYIPGSDTCIRLGGYLRADVGFNASGVFNNPAWNGNSGQGNRLRNDFISRVRQAVNIDTRTATEYGVLRTYFQGVFNWATGTDVNGRGTLGVFYAFIQFGGFTIGKSISQFDAPWTSYPANLADALVGGSGDSTGVNQLSYTADFGNGVTAAISAQDPTAYYQTNIWNTSFPGSTAAAAAGSVGTGVYGTSSLGGTTAPDVVGMVRVDQAWGLFQASLAAHDNHAVYYTPTLETSGHPDDKWGWAGQLSLSIKNIPTGPGDTFNIQGVYSNGASRYVFHDQVATSFAMYGGSGLPGAYQSIAFAGVSDAVLGGTSIAGATTGLALTSAWGVRGGFIHNWNPRWNSSIFGGYASLSYSGTGKTLVCAAVAPLLVAGSTCNPDFDIWQIGTKTSWTPVENMTFSGEVLYTSLNQKYSGAIALPAIGTKPAGTYEFKDQDTWSLAFRAQRNF